MAGMDGVVGAAGLRRDVNARALVRGDGDGREMTYAACPSVIYGKTGGGHGNFIPASYKRICADAGWRKRL